MSEDEAVVRPASWRRRMGIILICVAVFPVLFLASKSVMSSRPESLGVVDGQLPGCPASPNCVSTQATDDDHHVDALTYSGSADEAMARLTRVIEQMPRTNIVTADENYLHAEFTTLIFRYVDDVEFLLEPDAGRIQLRSASRIGYSDLGANRSRVDAIRAAWETAAGDDG